MSRELEKIIETPAPWIVGVLNVTPDSFSDGGKFLHATEAVRQAEALHRAGVAIIEVGGEATGPGSQPITAIEEIARIEKVVQMLAPRYFVSVDTYHAETARMALHYGARMINDVSALRGDATMASVLAASDCLVALMHAKDFPLPHVTSSPKKYGDVVLEVAAFLKDRVMVASRAGISSDRIILDPGLGSFLSSDDQYSWELLKRLSEFKDHGIANPIMIGASRKGFVARALKKEGRTDIDARSREIAELAIAQGAQFIRSHHW